MAGIVDCLRGGGERTRERRLLAALSVLALSISVGCSGDSNSAPRLGLESSVYELGTLVPGQRTVGSLSLRNPGSKTLVVRKVRTSNPGLTAQVVPTPLRAGERGKLELDFQSNTWDDEGPFENFILLYSNDPEEPLVKVTVRGSLESPIAWGPKIPLIPSLRRGMTRNLVRVEAGDNKSPLGPLRVESFVPFATAEAIREGPGAYRVVLKIDPAIPFGPLLGWVRIETRNPELPEVDVPVRSTVVGNLVANPSQLDFGLVREGRAATAAVTLLTRPGRNVHIVTVEPHLPAKVDVSVRRQGRNPLISVRVPSAPRRWSLAGYLNVYTDDPLQPVVQVPVVGWVGTAKPFERVAADGNDAGLYGLLEGALITGEDKLPAEHIAREVLGGGRDPRAVALLLRAQKDDNWYVRQRATDVLGVLGARQALEAVRAAVTDDVDSDVRQAAAKALVKIEGKAALPQLLLALQDDDEFVRFDVATLLGPLGDKRAIPALLRAAESDLDPATRAAARRSVSALKVAS